VNRALKRLSLAVLVMFLLLMVNINYVQGFEANSLAGKPQNSRAFDAKFQYQRGEILTADGKVMAKSVPSNDELKFQRVYPQGPEYSPITGYQSLFSNTGLELYENSLLSGNSSSLTVRNFIDLITGKKRSGANVTTTINSAAQDAAYQQLAATLSKTPGKTGAVVAIDPSTGAILAMASYPSFDPNLLAVHSGTTLDNNDKQLLTAAGNPLLNHALYSTYPPGSTFKIVTGSAFYASNPGNNPQTMVDSPQALPFNDSTHTLTNDNGEICGDAGQNGQTQIIQAFYLSCDTTFGKLGDNLGGSALSAQAVLYGMNDKNLNIPMPVTSSNYVTPQGQALTAYSAIGQFSDTVTALQEAMFSSAVANNGKLMTPYLVQQVTASDLSTLRTAQPSVLQQTVSANVATYLGQMMEQVTQNPAGTAGAYNATAVGYNIAGKTGTAQNGVNNSNLNDAVFTAFAPYGPNGNGNPRIAVGVIIQGGGYGATAAAPIAVQVIKAYLKYLQDHR
jgi:penicillin-binding protein A